MRLLVTIKLFLLSLLFCLNYLTGFGQKLPLNDTLIVRLNTDAQDFIAKKDWQMASARFEQIAKIAENEFITWFNLAEAYRKDKQYRKSLEAYKNSLKFEENNLCSFWIAVCYAELKDKDNTLNWLEKAEEGTLFIYPLIKEVNSFDFISETERFKKLIKRLKKELTSCATVDSLSFIENISGKFIIKTPAGLEVGSGTANYQSETCFLNLILSFIDKSVITIQMNLMEVAPPEVLTIQMSDSFGKEGKIPLHSVENNIIRFDKTLGSEKMKKQFKTFSLAKVKDNLLRISYAYTNKQNKLTTESFTLIMN
jgi:tetratricopeptide (TPR) repeat protein